MDNLEYSIVITAYNEADKISATLTQIVNFMREFCGNFEVVVNDDGSKDNTADIVEQFSKENPEVKILRNPHRGKGPGIWSGIMEAKGDLIYMADADLSAPISELKKLSIWIKDQGFDIVIASREGTGAQRIDEPFYRHLMGRVFNFWVKIVAVPGINDTQCGFKLFKKFAAKDVFDRLRIYGSEAPEIKKAYMGAFDVEVLYIAKKLKYKVKEVPVTWKYVKTTRLSPFSDSLKMAMDVFKIRINDLRGVYKPSKVSIGDL